MITPTEIIEKTEKSFYKIVSAYFKGEQIFPWTIPSNKQLSGNNYSDWKNDLIPLYNHSKEKKGKGYSVHWKEKIINGSKQSIPAKIFFETLDDYLAFVKKEKDFKHIQSVREKILTAFPLLNDWVNVNIPLLSQNSFETWHGVLKVVQYFSLNPPPHKFYVRELPIEVHSKFIEQNSQLLKKILDSILPVEWINNSENDFSGRYNLRKVGVYAQLRILDEKFKSSLGYNDVSLTLEDVGRLAWKPKKVFIIENQVCYLTFPNINNSVAIFGEGFKSRLTQYIPWLKNARIYCWFDMDTAGFEMLNMIKQLYPQAQSFLMDLATYREFSQFAVELKRSKKELPLISFEEQEVYQFLLANNKRLEQEKISQKYVIERIKDLEL